jgi:hypothetical protein
MRPAFGKSYSVHGCQHADEYVFDFAGLGHTEPFGILYAAAIMKEFMGQQFWSNFRAMNCERHRYQNHMGFFRALGFQYGNHPGVAAGGGNYLPITGFRR